MIEKGGLGKKSDKMNLFLFASQTLTQNCGLNIYHPKVSYSKRKDNMFISIVFECLV